MKSIYHYTVGGLCDAGIASELKCRVLGVVKARTDEVIDEALTLRTFVEVCGANLLGILFNTVPYRFLPRVKHDLVSHP